MTHHLCGKPTDDDGEKAYRYDESCEPCRTIRDRIMTDQLREIMGPDEHFQVRMTERKIRTILGYDLLGVIEGG